MKKKIVSFAVMMMMVAGLMPITQVHAENVEGELKLTANRTEQIVVPEGKSLTLDLAGYDLSVTGKSAIVNHGTLTIVNTSSTVGTVSATGTASAAVAATPGAHTYIDGGNYYSAAWYTIKNDGTMILNSTGTYSVGTNNSSSVIVNGWYNNSSTSPDIIDGVSYAYTAGDAYADLTVNAGTVIGNCSTTTLAAGTKYTSTGVISEQSSKVTVNNVTIKNVKNGFYTDKDSSMVINNATASALKNAVYADNGSSIIVSGGTFEATGCTDNNYSPYTFSPISIKTTSSASVEAYSGTFTGSVENSDSTGKIEVFGGTFKNADGTVFDVSAFVTAPTIFDAAKGTVTTKTISTITKYVLFSAIPDPTSFSYTITNAAGNDTGDTVIQTASTSGYSKNEEVRDGVNPSAVKFVNSDASTSTLEFSVNDFNAGQKANTLASLGVTDSGDERQYASKQLVVDFSAVKFTNPGIFRYTLTETSNNEKIPASGVLYFDVWVVRGSANKDDAAYNTLSVSSVIAHTDTALTLNTANNANTVSNKTSYLKSISVMNAMNLTVKHYALGNQASKTQKFKYTLTLRDATKGSTVSYIKKDGTKGSISVGNDGMSTYDFYLSDKEAITFLNISEFPGYTVKADEQTLETAGLKSATKIESYQLATSATDSTTTTVAAKSAAGDAPDTTNDETATAIDVNGTLAAQDTTSKYEVTDSKLSTNTTVVFSVYKQGTIPTGVILSVAPYAVVVLAGFFGLIIFAIKRKSKDEEEEA